MKSEGDSILTKPNNSDLAAQLSDLNRFASVVMSEDVKALRNEFRDQFRAHHLRLRPSVGGFSLVSCDVNTPQIGFSALKSPRQLRAKLERLAIDPKAICEPRKKTPEKRLQSWLLQTAVSSGGRFKSASLHEEARQWLVSDEIALTCSSSAGRKYRIVADILLVEEDAAGRARLVSVELKSSRVTSTFEQVRMFRALLDRPELEHLWQRFASTMTGREFKWARPFLSRGVVVWPVATPASIPKRTKSLISQYKDIDVIGYSSDGGGYQFMMEAST